MIRRFLAGFVVLSLSAVACADDLNSIILVGEKDQVLQLLTKSLDAEFSDGTRTYSPDGVGYRMRFNSFWTGATELNVLISPVGKGDSVEADGYGLAFRWTTQRRDGRQHAIALVNQIVQQGSKQTMVSIDRDVSSYRSTIEQAQRCTNRLVDAPELKPISDKVALGAARDQSFAMLANETVPTEEEKKIVMIWATKRDACAKGVKGFFAFWPNLPYAPIDLGVIDAGNQLILGLYKGAFTYGQYAKFRSDVYKQYQDASRKVAAEMEAKDAEANERARKASLEAAKLMLEQQRVINETYKPRPSAQTNCQTMMLGNTLQTTCN